MSSALRKLATLALVSVAVALVAPGCSQQGEGERCDKDKNGDEDCDSGLTCTPKDSLLEGITDRCCPAAGTETDKRCTPRSVASEPGGRAGSGGVAGTGGSSAGVVGGEGGAAPVTTGGEGGSMSQAGTPAVSEAGQSMGGDAAAAVGGNGAGGTP